MSADRVEPLLSWTTEWTDVLDTGTWRSALPVHEWRPSACHILCPVGGSIPRWIRLLAEGAEHEAWLAMVEQNPLPAVTGRACHHPCESSCNRAELDEAVGINALEHHLGERALQEKWGLPLPDVELDQRVAVVGGGPAGLACAYHLRRLGYQVTLYEARAELGGLLRYGIPEYRLPKAVLRGEVARLLALGIEARLESPVAGAQMLAALAADYQAVFVAVGAQRARRLTHLNAAGGLPVYDGLEFLAWTNDGAVTAAFDDGAGTGEAGSRDGTASDLAERLGEQVVVIGGGSAAMDVARSLRRLGKAATLVCLEERPQMPAQAEEISRALEEGARLVAGAMVQSVDRLADGRLVLRCCQVKLDEGPAPGEPLPVEITGTEFDLDADAILVAIGQEAEVDSFGGLLTAEGRLLAVDSETMQTSRAGVFAGGDVAGALRYVSQALGDGRRAAYGIARYLGSPHEQPERYRLEECVPPEHLNLHYFERAERAERETLPLDERLSGFREETRALEREAAAAEAGRCLSCGTCLRCDICALFCPDLAVRKDERSEQGYYILEQYCKGCGLCAAECPRGVVRLVQEQK